MVSLKDTKFCRQSFDRRHKSGRILIKLKANLNCLLLSLIVAQIIAQVKCQLPDDIQRELNQNLAEQARIQAQRARHQQLIQSKAGNAQRGQTPASAGQQQAHDPNNYSYQQVSPPVQYSYYQPYGDLAKPQQQPAQSAAAQQNGPTKPINIDLNNLNFDDLPNLPTPQAQTGMRRADNQQTVQPRGQVHLTPSFTGAGGLPVLKPISSAAHHQSPLEPLAPAGQTPLPPQAQQGPPLTEADFKDITGGENYGAPGGSDFGMGAANRADNQAEPQNDGSNQDSNNDDAQLREFGMSDNSNGAAQQRSNQRAEDNPMTSMGLGNDFGNFNPMAPTGGRRAASSNTGFDPFGSGDFAGMAGNIGGLGGGASNQRSRQPAADFDFASQPSSRGDQTQASMDNAAAPGSLQTLLGNSFPGLGGSNGNMGLDALARGNNGQTIDSQLDNPQRQQRADDGSMDVADLGDRSDGFSGADLGDFEKPSPQNDQDYNYAAAAHPQPVSVPYPDGSPQFVGTLLAITQPQSLSQTRYNPMPDKGTYQDYPAYQSGGNNFAAVQGVVDETPRARRAGLARYSQPTPDELAPEYREVGANMDYSKPPGESLTGSASGLGFGTQNSNDANSINIDDNLGDSTTSDFL